MNSRFMTRNILKENEKVNSFHIVRQAQPVHCNCSCELYLFLYLLLLLYLRKTAYFSVTMVTPVSPSP